jgi:hypothetical protein
MENGMHGVLVLTKPAYWISDGLTLEEVRQLGRDITQHGMSQADECLLMTIVIDSVKKGKDEA